MQRRSDRTKIATSYRRNLQTQDDYKHPTRCKAGHHGKGGLDSGTPWTRRFSTFESFMTGTKATVGPLTKCFRNTRLKRNEHITAGSWKWRKAHLHPSFSPLAEAWGKRLKLSIRESQHSYQTKGEHPIVIRFLTYAENSASQSSAQPSPPSEDTEEEQSNGATTRTATSTSYQDGLVICVDIMFIF